MHDESLVRPAELDVSYGDPSKARAQLGWEPRLGFERLVERLVEAEVGRQERASGGPA